MAAIEIWVGSLASAGVLGFMLSARRALGKAPLWIGICTVVSAAAVACLAGLALHRDGPESAGLLVLASAAAAVLGRKSPGSGGTPRRD